MAVQLHIPSYLHEFTVLVAVCPTVDCGRERWYCVQYPTPLTVSSSHMASSQLEELLLLLILWNIKVMLYSIIEVFFFISWLAKHQFITDCYSCVYLLMDSGHNFANYAYNAVVTIFFNIYCLFIIIFRL